jgi:hypothetical protein
VEDLKQDVLEMAQGLADESCRYGDKELHPARVGSDWFEWRCTTNLTFGGFQSGGVR